MPDEKRDRLLKTVVARAATSPAPLFLGTLGGLFLVSPQLWPAGILALIASGGAVWWRIQDPAYARQCAEQLERERWRFLVGRLEEEARSLDYGAASTLSAIVESQERLLALHGAAKMLPHTRIEMTALLDHCLSLAEKRSELRSHLDSFNEHDIWREQAQLQGRLDAAPDLATRALFEQALDQKRQELANHAQLAAAVARIDGQLAVVQCTFDNIVSKVIRLNSVDARTVAAPEDDPVFQELNNLTTRVSELEESLDETLTLRVGA